MRHKFTRITAALVAGLFAFCAIPQISAEENSPLLCLQAEESYPGAESTVQICLKDNPGLTALAAVLTLPEGITPVTDADGTPQFTPTDALSAGYLSCRLNPENSQISLVYAADEAGTADELLGSLAVTVSPDLEPNQTLSIGLSLVRIADTSGAIAADCTAENAFSVGEVPVLRGDTDLDGTISMIDARLALLSYVATDLSMMDSPLDERQLRAADVDGNGKVEMRDAKAILDYVVMTQAFLEPDWDTLLSAS